MIDLVIFNQEIHFWTNTNVDDSCNVYAIQQYKHWNGGKSSFITTLPSSYISVNAYQNYHSVITFHQESIESFRFQRIILINSLTTFTNFWSDSHTEN